MLMGTKRERARGQVLVDAQSVPQITCRAGSLFLSVEWAFFVKAVKSVKRFTGRVEGPNRARRQPI